MKESPTLLYFFRSLQMDGAKHYLQRLTRLRRTLVAAVCAMPYSQHGGAIQARQLSRTHDISKPLYVAVLTSTAESMLA